MARHEAGGRTVPVPEGNRLWQSPPEDDNLVGAFLRDQWFLFASPNAYNSLGVGTTQLQRDSLRSYPELSGMLITRCNSSIRFMMSSNSGAGSSKIIGSISL